MYYKLFNFVYLTLVNTAQLLARVVVLFINLDYWKLVLTFVPKILYTHKAHTYMHAYMCTYRYLYIHTFHLETFFFFLIKMNVCSIAITCVFRDYFKYYTLDLFGRIFASLFH